MRMMNKPINLSSSVQSTLIMRVQISLTLLLVLLVGGRGGGGAKRQMTFQTSYLCDLLIAVVTED